MSDKSPRLSDEHSGHFDALAGHPLHDAARAHDPDHDANAWHDLDRDPNRPPTLDDRAVQDAERGRVDDGLSEDAALYGDTAIADDAHHLSADLIDELHGGAEPHEVTSTAMIGEAMEIYGGKPLRGEHDSRDVWIDRGQDLDALEAELRDEILAAYEQVRDGIRMILDAVAPRGYQMEDRREPLFYNIVSGIDHDREKMERRVREITAQIETLRKTQTRRIEELGHDGASLELEEKTHQLLSAAEQHEILERMRDFAAEAYFKETLKVWAPRKKGASHVSQTGDVAARIDSREFLKARANHVAVPEIPEGTVVAVTGTRTGPGHARIIDTLNAYLQDHPDMILLHGNAPGAQRIAAKWAGNKGVPQVSVEPDSNKHGGDWKAAIKARDRQILAARPDRMVSFTGAGERLPFLHRLAVERGIPAEQVGERATARRHADKRQGADTGHTRDRSQPARASTRAPVYAGVGARATPGETLSTMTAMSDWLGKRGWQLRSGGAHGADDAFAKGADASARTVLLPWEGYNGRQGADCVVPSPDVAGRAREIAASLHPAWDKCDDAARSLHARNAAIVLGPDLDSPVDALVCWTEEGKTVGGTGMAIRIAEKYDVPVFNLATSHPREICQAMTALEEQAAMRRDNSATAADGLAEAAAGYTAPAVAADIGETARGADHARKPSASEQARADAFLASARQESSATDRTHDALARDAFTALTNSFIREGATHELSLHDVTQGMGDVYEADRKIGMIERVIVPHEGYPMNAHLLQLDRDPGHVYVIPPGKDPAAETQAILDRLPISAATHLSAGRHEDHARKAEPHEQAIADAFLGAADRRAAEPASRLDLSPSQAFEALIESILPEDNRLSEEAARSHGDQTHPLRKALMERIIGAVDSVTSGPHGAEEQLSDLRREGIELAHRDTGSDIDLNQQQELAEKSRYASDSLTALHAVQEELRTFFADNTGERYTPPAPDAMVRDRRVTAASAEAIDHVERLEQERYQARLPAGRPIVVTALNSAATREEVCDILDKVHAKHPDKWIAHGAGQGVLQHVTEWATAKKVEQVHFHPDWKAHPNKNAAIAKRDLAMLGLNPIGIIEFNDGKKPSLLAKQIASQNKDRVHTVRSGEAKSTARQEDRSWERSATEMQSRDLAPETSAGMSW